MTADEFFREIEAIAYPSNHGQRGVINHQQKRIQWKGAKPMRLAGGCLLYRMTRAGEGKDAAEKLETG